MATTPYEVYLEAALGDPSKEHGIRFEFHPKGNHTSPFDIGDWPDIRANLRQEVRQRMDDLDEWESYVLSDRTGERLSVHVGEVYLTDSGDVDRWQLRNTSVDDVNW